MRRPAQRDLRDEGGFSLIEVVVALFLLGIVATAGLTFFFRGMQNTSQLQRTQNAVAVANQAMEKVRAVTPRIADTVTSTSGLLIGRSQTAVLAAWSTAAASDTAESNAVWDTAAATRTDVALDIVETVTVSDQEYTITTLIGTCYRLKAASVSDQTCVKTNPGATAAQLYRVTVVVSWKPGTGECVGGDCTYRVSTLLDPTADANWNLTAKPVAYDDETTMVTGGATDIINTLSNDVYGFVAPGVNPTTITVNPTIGAASAVTSGSEIGRIRYTPPANDSGITSLKYRLKDGAGRTSNEATLVVRVRPSAVNTSATVETSSATSIPLSVRGTGLTVVPVPAGSATVSGTSIVYNAPSSPTVKTFSYKVVDSSGLESDTATLTVTVVHPSPPAVTNVPVSIFASPGTVTRELNIKGALGLTPASAFTISQAAGGVTRLAGGTTAGTVAQSAVSKDLTWTIGSGSANQVGVYTLNYTAVKGTSAPSATRVATVSVVPLATSFTDPTQMSVSGQRVVAMPSTNAPTATNYTGLTYLVSGPPTCSLGTNAAVSVAATATQQASGPPVFKAPTWTGGSGSGTCAFTYTMRWTSGSYVLNSDPAVATMSVRR